MPDYPPKGNGSEFIPMYGPPGGRFPLPPPPSKVDTFLQFPPRVPISRPDVAYQLRDPEIEGIEVTCPTEADQDQIRDSIAAQIDNSFGITSPEIRILCSEQPTIITVGIWMAAAAAPGTSHTLYYDSPGRDAAMTQMANTLLVDDGEIFGAYMNSAFIWGIMTGLWNALDKEIVDTWALTVTLTGFSISFQSPNKVVTTVNAHFDYRWPWPNDDKTFTITDTLTHNGSNTLQCQSASDFDLGGILPPGCLAASAFPTELLAPGFQLDLRYTRVNCESKGIYCGGIVIPQ